MVKTVSKFELYNSQSTHYLQKKAEEFKGELITKEIKEIKDIVTHILEAREEWNHPRPCLWTCDGSCKELCKNNAI